MSSTNENSDENNDENNDEDNDENNDGNNEENNEENMITNEHHNAFRLMLIVYQVVCPVLKYVFHFGSQPKKDDDMTLKEYLIDIKGMTNANYRKYFNKTSRDKIDNDPSCESFDVSLWIPAIQWGCHNIASPEDRIWITHGYTLENHLKRIKDFRNCFLHGNFIASDKECFEKTEEIQSLLIDTMNLTKSRYGIDENKINERIQTLNSNINIIRDGPLSPVDLKSYKNIFIFFMLKERLLDIGKKDLFNLYNRISHIYPFSMIAGNTVSIEVSPIFISLEMVFGGRDEQNHAADVVQLPEQNHTNNVDQLPEQNQMIDVNDLLAFAHQRFKDDDSSVGQIILLEGIAGAGKTTLVKLILSNWISDRSSIKELDKYEFVIYMECRSKSFRTLSSLISSQMPGSRRYFHNDNDMKDCMLDMPCLIIVDGLDEMNSVSKEVFEEIINLRMIENATIICTSRPEKVMDYYRMVSAEVKTIHIKIQGIPDTQKEKFLIKYHEAIRGDKYQERQDLRNYFATKGARLKDQLKYPLDLTLLVLLWTEDQATVNSITTSTELLRQLHKLIKNKLLRRLANNELTRDKDTAVLERNVSIFIDTLCEVAMESLRDDSIILPNQTTNLLEHRCNDLCLPPEEMLGAFLVKERSWTSVDHTSNYCFQHKGLQDFYAGLWLYKMLSDTNSELPLDLPNLLDEMTWLLSRFGVPSQSKEEILEFTNRIISKGTPGYKSPSIFRFQLNLFPRKKKLKITDILQHLHRNETLLPFEKYQNVLIILMGLFHHPDNEDDSNEDRTGLLKELVDLLNKSGIQNSEEWLRVLNNVECSNKIAKIIASSTNIMKGSITIDDNNIYAFNTLFKVTRAKDVSLKLCWKPDEQFPFHELHELLTKISEHKCHFKEIIFMFMFRYPNYIIFDNLASNFKSLIQKLLRSCQVDHYQGAVYSDIILPESVKVLHVSIPDSQSYNILQSQISSGLQIKLLNLCLSGQNIYKIDTPLPSIRSIIPPALYITDVGDTTNIEHMVFVIKNIMPTKGSFSWIYFPRCSLSATRLEHLLRWMYGVTISYAIVFPSNCRPALNDDNLTIQDLAQKLHCRIDWGIVKDVQHIIIENIDDW